MSNYEQIFKFNVDGTVDIDSAKAVSSLNELSKNFKNFKKTSSEAMRLTNQVDELQESLSLAHKMSAKGFLDSKEQRVFGNLLVNISKQYDVLIKKAAAFNESGAMAGPLVDNIEAAQKALNELNQAMGKGQKNLEKSMKKAGDPTRFAGIDLSAYNLDVKDTNAMSKKLKGIGKQLSKDFSESFAIKNDVSLKNILSQETIDRQTKYFQDRIASYQGIFDEKTAAGDSKGAKAAEAKLNGMIAKFEQFKNISKDVTVFNTINDEMKKLDSLFGSFDFQKIAKAFDFDESILDIKALRAALAEADDQLRILEESSRDTNEAFIQGASKASDASRTLGERQKEAADKTDEHKKKVKQLSDTMMNFFSLQNGWNLLQRGARKAFETVKELDAAMTEIAVVSEYSLGDIWEKRSEYSDAATEMGAKTIDLVNATKLYIQQGLDLDESLQIAIETTKMARIANLDGTEATNLMTAALRGFNMEMIEANRVNDVYSQLAAKSAADTKEIATALSKTASIANSAGASFENTSAFLTQIIETTREAPETAGTSLKTIIARFQELKKPLSEIQEVDGESVNANRIEGALAQAGVALRDANGEFRNFDDVIFELSGKWEGLDKMTQRYIATMAAGSRQQSRFLALLSNNSRLTELAGFAADSAGASQEQFNKTLDSLEAKLNKLSNALSIFYTNLLDNDVIKFAIEAFTGLLNILNSFTGVLSSTNNSALSFIGTLVQLAAVAGVFSLAKKGINAFSNMWLSTTKDGAKAGSGFISGMVRAIDKGDTSVSASLGKLFSGRFAKGAAISAGASLGLNLLSGLSNEIFGEGHMISSVMGVVAQASVGVSVGMTAAAIAAKFLTGSLAGLAGPIGIAVGVLTTIVSIVGSIESSEEKIAKVQRQAQDAKKVASDAKEAYDALLNSEETYSGTLDRLNELEAGTKAWKDQLLEVKEAALAIQEQFPDLKISYDENGVPVFDKDQLRKEKDKRKNYSVNAGVGEMVSRYRSQNAGPEAQIEESKQNIERINREIERQNDLFGESTTLWEIEQYNETIRDLNDDLAEERNKIAQAQKLIDENGAILNGTTSRELALDQSSLDGEARFLASQMFDEKTWQDHMTNAISSAFDPDEVQEILGTSVGGDNIADLQQMYAEATGQALEDIKKTDLGQSEERLKEALSSMAANKTFMEDFGVVIGRVGQMSEDQLTYINNLLSGKVSAENLDRTTLESNLGMEPEQVDQLFATSGGFGGFLTKVQQVGEDMAAETAIMKDVLSASDIPDDVIQAFEKATKGSPFAFNTIAEVARSLETQTSGAGSEFLTMMTSFRKKTDEVAWALSAMPDTSPESIETFKKTLDEMGISIPESQIQEMITALDSGKITIEGVTDVALALSAMPDASPESIETFRKTLDEMGISIPESQIQRMITALDSAKIAIEGVTDAANVLAGIDSLNALIRDLRNGGTDTSISEEDYKTVIGNDPSQAENFFKDSTGEFMYRGSATELATALSSAVESISNKELSAARDKVLVGNAAQLASNSQGLNIDQMADWTAEDKGKFLAAMISDPNVGSALNLTDAQLAEYSDPKMTDVLNRVAAALTNLDTNKGHLDTLEAGTRRASTQRMMSAPEVQGAMMESTGDEKAIRAQRDRLIELARQYKVTEGEIKDYVDATKNSNKASMNAADEAFTHKIELMQLKETYGDLIDEIYDSIDAVYAFQEGTADYEVAVQRTADALTDYLNMDISSEFLKEGENLDLLADGLDGNQEAWNSFVSNASYTEDRIRAMGEQMGLTEEAINVAVAGLDGKSFDINGNMDASQVFNELSAVMGSTQKAAAFINELAGMGVDFSVQYETKYIDVPTYVQTMGSSNTRNNPEGLTTMSGVKVQNHKQAIRVPKFVGNIKNPANFDKIGNPSAPSRRVDRGPSRGGGGSGGGSGGRGGGSGSKDKEEPWVHSYDWLYNLVQKTNEEIRKRNKLEWEYNKLLEQSGAEVGEALTNRRNQYDSLYKTQSYWQEQNKKRLQEVRNLQKEYSDVGKYATYDEAIGYVTIDWNAIDKVSGTDGNNEVGERIDEFISKLETISGQIDDTEDELMSIEDQIYELSIRGRDDLAGLEDQIISAIETLRQKEIDELQNLSDTINNANTSMLDKISTGLSDLRAQREQDKALEEIQKNERQLSLMRQDTSGSNALDILAMEKGLEDSRQAYTDSLIDKNLEAMTRQNQQAFDQRQMQIDLMTAQLDWDREQGVLAAESNKVITDAIRTGNPTAIVNLLKESELYKGMGVVTKDVWSEELNNAITAGFDYWIDSNSLTGSGQRSATLRNSMKGKSITFTDKSGVQRTGTVNTDGSVKVGNQTYKDVTRGADGSWVQASTGAVIGSVKPPAKQLTTLNNKANTSPAVAQSQAVKSPKIGGWVKVGTGAKFTNGLNFNESVRQTGFDSQRTGGFYVYQQKGNAYLIGNGKASVAPNWTGWIDKKYLTAYKTGGIVDFTGPAWLDGTKSRPEAVLNSTDTYNVRSLAESLRSLTKGSNSSLQQIYYTFNVDASFKDDYSVEDFWKTIRKEIETEASYKHVPVLNLTGRR